MTVSSFLSNFRLLILFFFLITQIYSDSCTVGDCKDGKGVKLFTNGDRYEGDFKNGTFDGEGIFQSSKGYKYSGKFKDGKKHGLGVLVSTGIENKSTNDSKNPSHVKEANSVLLPSKSTYYEGEWKYNKKEGKGKLIIQKNGKVKTYSGQFVNGKLNGKGTIETDLVRYTGNFKNNRLNGQGVFVSREGEKYVGEFWDHKFDGKGTYTFKDGSMYIGDFKVGKLNGKGRMFSGKHKVIRSGRWINGEFKN